MLIRLFIISLVSITSFLANAAGFSFSGVNKPVVAIGADKSSGLEAVYVAPTTSGLSVTFTPDNPGDEIVWYSFGPEGAAYAEQIATGATLTGLTSDRGYAAEVGNRRTYFWLIDYSLHPFLPQNITPNPAESDCGTIELNFDGRADRLNYYAVTGRRIDIDREIELKYFTLEAEESSFIQREKTVTLPYISSVIHAPSPLCSTRFTLSGDRFLKEWKETKSISTDAVTPTSVSAVTAVKTENREIANEQTDGTSDEIGGSAPVTINFTAAVTDAVVFTEWQLATDSEMQQITLRERSTDWTYTFTDAGSFYVRFVAANADGSCQWESDIYRVGIGESRLRCPNAFSPGTSEGVNDVWCVSYRSIIEFDCTIFNRWGVKITHLSDPSQGWDGKYKGKLVDPGVYYYVIKARGADGKDYNLSGDINIIGKR